MRLSHRIFLGYFFIVALAGIFLLLSVRDELRPAMRHSMEDTMVDTANLLAEMVERDIQNQQFDTAHFAQSMQDYMKREPIAKIWGLSKSRSSLRVYITDAKGIVRYDSQDSQNVGKDYSKWNDVHLTLKGQYGARSTRTDPDDPSSSTMYVAAPVLQNGEIIGVLTVAKPTLSIMPFIELSQNNIARAGLILFVVSMLLGWLFAQLTLRSVRKLAAYARSVSQGERVTLPAITGRELAQLGHAMEHMRQALEGKEYVERYVHHLTHEIKSPLSGIAAASELLTEEMSRDDRARFIGNIRGDTARIQNIVDRLLDLARLEQQQHLQTKDPMQITSLVDDVIKDQEPLISQKKLNVTCDVPDEPGLYGDPFLLRQAINNVLDNAIDFSPLGATIIMTGRKEDSHYILTVADQGPGIPDYAISRVFERFYSLPRPDTGRKSTGLGLSFVREVMALHGGNISVKSAESGCVVALSLPLR